MPISYTPIANSTYLDFDSYLSGAPLPTGAAFNFTMNVALVFDRAHDPTDLLSADWGARQQELAALNASNTLWSTYGAKPADYNAAVSALAALPTAIATFYTPGAPANQQYVSTPESRTLWVSLNQDTWTELFGTALLKGQDQSGSETYFWNNSLSLPSTLANLGIKGLWFDATGKLGDVLLNPGSGGPAALPQGAQSIGNSAGAAAQTAFPSDIAAAYYNFPLTGALWNPASGIAAPTGTIGLVEPGIGTAVPAGSFQTLIDAYRAAVGINTSAVVTDVAAGGQSAPSSGERSLDVGVVTSTNPQSPLVLYAGSGVDGAANGEPFTAYQSAFWDTVNNPEVVTSSFKFLASQPAPGSPFLFAAQQLFVDAALRNITVLSSVGDGGSGYEVGNGLTNISITRASPYGLVVGGTSLSTVDAAQNDASLATIVAAAMAGDQATIWQLIEGGLTVMPSSENQAQAFVETVWNRYMLHGTTLGNGTSQGYLSSEAGSGGVDFTQHVPSYQRDFGLTPTTSDPHALVGRGVPDVAAPAGGNMFYNVPLFDMTGLGPDGGTSAATPFWAALVSQIDAIFHDQGLPQLGYANDLFYIAASIAPAAFHDVTLGNNISSFVLGGTFLSDGDQISPTGYGYLAGPGYDLVTGLGSPNGVLLARALSAIGHSQMFFPNSPDMLKGDDHAGWTSGADQSLLFQTMSDAATQVGIHLGPDAFGFFSGASNSFAWTSQMAQAALQSDFDPALVTLFDKQSQGTVAQSLVHAGESLSVSLGSSSTQAIQGTLSNPFGFADFLSGDGAVRVARPVAVAETADGGSNETAIVRLRQDGTDNLSITFYRVDDLSGTINGLHPGDAGYQATLQGRAYQMTTGGTSISGPGYGNYEQSGLSHVNAGDFVAMQLTDTTHGAVYSGFAQANETVNGQHVGHLWNYGLNTWGWEDTYGGGDHDYNDLIVGLDFTSASGHGWLA